MSEEQKPTWAIVELMGHVRLAGRLTEEEKFGGKLGRLDIPQGEGFITQYFGSASVYRISLVTEDVARHVAKQGNQAPVSPWDFPARLPKPEEPRDAMDVHSNADMLMEDDDEDPEDYADHDYYPQQE